MRFLKIFLTTIIALTATIVAYAQQQPGAGVESKKPQTILTNTEDKPVDFPINAPIIDADDNRLYFLRKVNFHGSRNFDPAVLERASGLIPGDSISLQGSFIQNAINRLWTQRYFADIRIGATIEGNSVDLEVFLKQRPLVSEWTFEGVPKGKQKDLLEQLKLKKGTELSDYVIDKNKKLIKAHFAEKGFLDTDVELRVINDTAIRDAVKVAFIIDKKNRVKIGKIDFEGNNNFTDKRLRRTFKKTHQRSILFWQNTKLKDAEYAEDKELLLDFYNSRGFRNATILSDSIYRIDDRSLGINIRLAEGNKYYIRNITWVGNSVFPTEQLSEMFSVAKGDTYDKKSMHKRLGIGKEMNPEEMSVSSLYQNDGYLMSQIEPSEIVVGKDSIDLEIKIFEGKQFTINNVDISGNLRVDDEVIRRELYTRPGELYNRALLMQTIRTLMSFGHFNAEKIVPDIKPVSNELVDINWPLEEQASDQFNIAGGWGSGTFVGSVGITLNNLSMRNFFKKGAWRPYPHGQNQRLSISGQTNGTYYKALAISFTDPWLGGRKPNSFTFSAHISESNDALYAWQKATQYFRSIGVAAGLGKRLNWPDPYFTLYAEASYQRYNLKGWSSFVMENGAANTLALKFVFGRNSVDQPIYPRRGSDFSVSLQITPPFSLWDGKNYSDPTMSDQSRYKWIEYHKWNFKAQWFYPLTRNNNLVLMARAEMGFLGHYNKNKVSPFERFNVGGDGMTGYNIYGVDIIALRGYEDSALDPVGESYSVAYNKYTLELRYPIVLKPSSQIYVLGFLEGGNGFSSWKDFSPFKIKRSAGIGARLYLPIVGMLGIDWGWGFDPAAGKSERSGSQFHFVLGQQF